MRAFTIKLLFVFLVLASGCLGGNTPQVYTLHVEVLPEGAATVIGLTPTGQYPAGVLASFDLKPKEGYSFAGWLGPHVPVENEEGTWQVEMRSTRTLTAEFRREDATLTGTLERIYEEGSEIKINNIRYEVAGPPGLRSYLNRMSSRNHPILGSTVTVVIEGGQVVDLLEIRLGNKPFSHVHFNDLVDTKRQGDPTSFYGLTIIGAGPRVSTLSNEEGAAQSISGDKVIVSMDHVVLKDMLFDAHLYTLRVTGDYVRMEDVAIQSVWAEVYVEGYGFQLENAEGIEIAVDCFTFTPTSKRGVLESNMRGVLVANGLESEYLGTLMGTLQVTEEGGWITVLEGSLIIGEVYVGEEENPVDSAILRLKGPVRTRSFEVGDVLGNIVWHGDYGYLESAGIEFDLSWYGKHGLAWMLGDPKGTFNYGVRNLECEGEHLIMIVAEKVVGSVTTKGPDISVIVGGHSIMGDVILEDAGSERWFSLVIEGSLDGDLTVTGENVLVRIGLVPDPPPEFWSKAIHGIPENPPFEATLGEIEDTGYLRGNVSWNASYGSLMVLNAILGNIDVLSEASDLRLDTETVVGDLTVMASGLWHTRPFTVEGDLSIFAPNEELLDIILSARDRDTRLSIHADTLIGQSLTFKELGTGKITAVIHESASLELAGEIHWTNAPGLVFSLLGSGTLQDQEALWFGPQGQGHKPPGL